MAWVLLFIGLIAITAGVRGQSAQAGQLLQAEFTGPDSFVQWLLAIMILGLLGYYRPIKPVTDAMIGLVIVGIVLGQSKKNGAFVNIFKAVEDAFQNAKATPKANASATNGSSSVNPASPSSPLSLPSWLDPTGPATGTGTTEGLPGIDQWSGLIPTPDSGFGNLVGGVFGFPSYPTTPQSSAPLPSPFMAPADSFNPFGLGSLAGSY